MCEVTLKIDENQVRKANPSLTSKEDITRWAQQLMDACIADLVEEEEYPLPEGVKPYTMEEINARIRESEADFAAGRYRSAEELFRDWGMELEEEEVLEEATV